MSLDNVLAIAGVAEGAYGITEAQKFWLYFIGVGTSIPLIIVGSALITAIVARFPIFVWAGAALLGYIAGGMIATDPLTEIFFTSDDLLSAEVRFGTWSMSFPQFEPEHLKLACEIVGALFVVATGYLLMTRRKGNEVRVRQRP
jgi:predicted tellurium resistance membrane protein TerC